MNMINNHVNKTTHVQVIKEWISVNQQIFDSEGEGEPIPNISLSNHRRAEYKFLIN